ncbi:hypothetical protein [Alteribacter keqinensis]|uniref:Uncharacterized protein n=1 Tax=Alteribacter keqinensis TaxID=2483800 RepID=A0A3M7TQ83_9BACI|nr:hypothetical protein [Alteribacter keqinensis]RNA67167.1 hypothetical protein EBO34_18470 [Alteribacter keqinensis]
MKQLLPLVIIAALIAGAMIFFQDPEEEREPDWSRNSAMAGSPWSFTMYAHYGDEPEIGFTAEFINEEEWETIEAVEVFIATHEPPGGLYYQDLDVENFEGTLTYQEPCSFCDMEEAFYDTMTTYATVKVAWQADGEVYDHFHHFQLPHGLFKHENEGENTNE